MSAAAVKFQMNTVRLAYSGWRQLCVRAQPCMQGSGGAAFLLCMLCCLYIHTPQAWLCGTSTAAGAPHHVRGLQMAFELLQLASNPWSGSYPSSMAHWHAHGCSAAVLQAHHATFCTWHVKKPTCRAVAELAKQSKQAASCYESTVRQQAQAPHDITATVSGCQQLSCRNDCSALQCSGQFQPSQSTCMAASRLPHTVQGLCTVYCNVIIITQVTTVATAKPAVRCSNVSLSNRVHGCLTTETHVFVYTVIVST
jgi:hypothetical protein